MSAAKRKLPVGTRVIWHEVMLDNSIRKRRAVVRRNGRDAAGPYVKIALEDSDVVVNVHRYQLQPENTRGTAK